MVWVLSRTHNTRTLTREIFFMNFNHHHIEDRNNLLIYRLNATHMDKNEFKLELYKIIVTEFGFLNPAEHVQRMYLYYNAHGWPKGGNVFYTLRFWMSREKRVRDGKHPVVNEYEKRYLKTLVERIPEAKVACRLLDVLLAFTLTDDKAIFHVREEVKTNITAWMENIDLPQIMSSYIRRDIIVK